MLEIDWPACVDSRGFVGDSNGSIGEPGDLFTHSGFGVRFSLAQQGRKINACCRDPSTNLIPNA